MFRTAVKSRPNCNINNIQVIEVEPWSDNIDTPISSRRAAIHFISQAVVERVRYSSLVEERDTVRCLLADQKITFEPSSVQKPHVDLCVSLHPAYSLSLKDCRVISVLTLRLTQYQYVPLR